LGLKAKSNQALQRLNDGNQRFVDQKRLFPHQSLERRQEVAGGQYPLAVILGCSDSRVPPEIIFDQGIGDLFIIRVAGNIIDDMVMGSMEYAVEHLHAPLILVLGHQKCGAVEAALKGGRAHGHVNGLLEMIHPAVEKAKNLVGDPLDNAVRVHLERMVAQLKAAEPILSEAVKSGQLKIIGGYYHLDSGRVEMMPSD
jgi:carbonic anhydrase